MNNLALAYLGDAVYELYIRKHLLDLNIVKVNDLQKTSQKYISAKGQCKIVEYLIEKNFFTENELDIYKRGRNSKSHASKSTDIITYKKSTGFETLIGTLYLENKNRLDEIMEEIFKNDSIW